MTAFFLVLWNDGGGLALQGNKKNSERQRFPKKNPGQLTPPGIFFTKYGALLVTARCYFICIIFSVAESVAGCQRNIHNTARSDTTKTYPIRTYCSALLSLPYRCIRQQYPLRTVIRVPSPSLLVFLTDNQFPQRIPTS